MANFAFVENNTIVGVYDLLPKNWKNISNFYALDDWEYLNSLGWFEIIKVIPVYNIYTQKLDNARHYIVDGIVYESYHVIDLPIVQPIVERELTPEEMELLNQQSIQNQWNEVRKIRDELMRDFEWRYSRYYRNERLNLTQIDNMSQMDEYMQQLADITLQNNPFEIIWPEYGNQ